jgi:cell division protein FtsQ
MPRSKAGWIAVAAVVLVFAGVCWGLYVVVKSAVLHDDRFVIPSSAAVEVQGNDHVTRAQLLTIFGGDIERNIFRVSLDERKAELEQLPWVEHATVMRLLPNRLRVSIVERTPVAFVRQGNHIGLIDANGVLLDMPMDVQANMNYSFPVVTGVTAKDPASVRAARMKIYERFTADLDSGTEKVSRNLSEVDLSDPEDVRATIPDKNGEVMVHFGEDNFLERYRKFQEHLPEWRAQYPKLASVDMRYDRQVVLEMKQGAETPAANAVGNAAAAAGANAAAGAAQGTAPKKEESAPKPKKPATANAQKSAAAHKTVVKKSSPAPAAKAKHAPQPAEPLYHPPQVVHP